MSWISRQYNNHKNGIIISLVFHIILLVFLNISQFNIKQEYGEEAEIIISFPEVLLEQPETEAQEQQQAEEPLYSTERLTNIASNRAANQENETFDEEYLKELEQAQNLVKDVSSQLSKEIPTFDDLQIPEETSEGMDPDSIMNKLYSGNSNVEYFLENRYHVRLPIPVYLAQYGGTVTVNIVVDQQGRVIKADPLIGNNVQEQLLSYAKTAALRTRFNPDSQAESRQTGYIRYIFVAQ
jgi:hypothetical protein